MERTSNPHSKQLSRYHLWFIMWNKICPLNTLCLAHKMFVRVIWGLNQSTQGQEGKIQSPIICPLSNIIFPQTWKYHQTWWSFTECNVTEAMLTPTPQDCTIQMTSMHLSSLWIFITSLNDKCLHRISSPKPKHKGNQLLEESSHEKKMLVFIFTVFTSICLLHFSTLNAFVLESRGAFPICLSQSGYTAQPKVSSTLVLLFICCKCAACHLRICGCASSQPGVSTSSL